MIHSGGETLDIDLNDRGEIDMQATQRNGAGPTTITRQLMTGAGPLIRLAAEHALQLELCDALEFIADGLPNRIPTKLVREVTAVLAHGMTAHFRIEEQILFPLLRERAREDTSLMGALSQLETEHGRDADLCGELAEELRSLAAREEPRNVEMLAYMLRGYFEGQRRHIEWENTIVLPAARKLLTEADLADLAAQLKGGSRKLSSLRNLPPEKRR